MNEMGNEIGQLSSILKTVVQQLQRAAPIPPVERDNSRVAPTIPIERDGSRSPRVGSNSMSKPSRKETKNLNKHFQNVSGSSDRNGSSMVFGRQNVDLLNNKGVIVSSGYIVTGKLGEMCHNRKVNVGEKKVFLEVVHDPYAAV